MQQRILQLESREEELRGELTQYKQRFESCDLCDRMEAGEYFFESSLDLACVAGFDGYFKRLNAVWEATLGYTQVEMADRPFIEFVHPDDREATLSAAAQLAEGNKVLSFENRYLCKDGSYRWLLWNATSSTANQLMYATARDISDRKRAETELKQVNQNLKIYLQAALESITDPLFIKDLSGRYVLINSACATLFDKKVEEMMGQDDFSLFPPEFASQIEAIDRKVIASGQTFRAEEEITMSGEKRTYLTTKDVCRDSQGNTIGLVGIARDISDRKQAEEALQNSETQLRKKAQQLELTLHELRETQVQLIQSEKMSGLGQMVAGIAHEINNPVNFIHGNLGHVADSCNDLLELIRLYQEYYPQTLPEIEDCIEEIDLEFVSDDLPQMLDSMRMGTDRIREIVIALRNFSRLDEAGMKEVDLHEGIESTLTVINSRLQDAIAVRKLYGTLPPIQCYPAKLNQVWLNLLTNAIDALELGTGIDLHNALIPIITIQTAQLDSQRLQIKIQDNGMGIPAKVRDKIFDPFFTTKTVGKGTGLGLSVCYQIVKQHGGQIEVSSRPGKGSIFTIALPIKQPQFST